MKKYFCIILIVILIFCGCSFFELPENTTEEYISPYVTDVNGNLVPKHEDVEESVLDPLLFSLDENGRMVYGNSEQLLLTGIDVSVFQGDIDWNQVAKDGIDFVMLRVGFRGYGTKGIMQIDEKFYENCKGADAAGLKVGVYFYSQAINEEEAREEARFVLEAIKGIKLQFPIAYDWEYVDNAEARTANMTSSEITACAKAFCEEIKAAGHTAIIYFNCEIGYFEYELATLSQYDFWLAEYFEYPSFVYDYKMWQYTDSGTVKGINGNVDINISLVDYSEHTVEYG
ncbi:MAG: glycoside hydrolase family 25 protein [Clostridia bacterium]|nr:glycoside hydrolase family 25 protein [Clostridia bacterium]